LIIAAVLITILAVFAFIANQQGWISQPEEIAAVEEKVESIVPVSVEASDDSLIAAMNTPEEHRDTTIVKKILPRP